MHPCCKPAGSVEVTPFGWSNKKTVSPDRQRVALISKGATDRSGEITTHAPEHGAADQASATPDQARRSFANHTADDAASSISGRVTRVIVLSGVDDDRSTAGMKDRIGLVLVKRDRGVEHFEIGLSIGRIAGRL